MAAMMAAMMPGPHHEALMKKAGSWETKTKFWQDPSLPAMETSGTATLESLMDGRFLMEVTKANMMGMPWEGRGIFGYDNTAKKHVGTWFDSFGTMMMSFEGGCESSCSVITLTSNYMDPATKTMKKMKSVSKTTDADHAVMMLYDVAQDGSETKMVEVSYTRVK